MNKPNWKWIFCPVLLSLLLMGCTNKKVGSAKETTITFASVYNPSDAGIKIIEKSLDEFEKGNPQIKIKRLWLSPNYRDYSQKLLTMFAGSTSPDIFRVAPDMLPQFIQKEALLPLDGYVEKSKTIFLKDFFPQVLYKYQFDGKEFGKGSIYGFGTDWSPDFALFYNKDLFDKAGLSYPTKSFSWEEYLEVAKKLTIRDKNGRATQFGTLLPRLDLLILQNGGEIFSPDGRKCLLDRPETTEAIQFLYDLRNKYQAAPSLSEEATVDEINFFAAGKLAMFFSGRYLVSDVQRIAGNKLRWSVAPSLHKKKRVNMITGPCGWAISSKSAHPKEAFNLLEYLVAGKGELKLAEIGYNIPVIKKVAYSDAFLTNLTHPQGINKLFLEEAEYSFSSPLNFYVPTERWRQIMDDEIELVYLNKKTPSGAAKDMASRINDLIISQIQKK
ncbi:MAG: sugar ABC transporter substrate-binding protein [Candidatus Omnitrophica bacterium]|nr:sugar ABC transporter substrate-binding protein [Candidatus Omnitrophota bacterium]